MTIKQRTNRGGRTPKAPINENIDATEIRLIDAEGNQVGVVPIADALKMAEEATLDLVQVTDSDPIVCKIMDYGKKSSTRKKRRLLPRRSRNRRKSKSLSSDQELKKGIIR